MGKTDVPHISTFECRSVLDSIQSEYDQLQKEDNLLSKLQHELTELLTQRNILSKRQDFNDKYCIICCSTFNLLFKRKLLCQYCQYLVCRSCASYDHTCKYWICSACEKQKALNATSKDWLSGRIRSNFGHFCAAKALQNFCRNRRISDSENDSGYGTAGDIMPLMKFLSSHSLQKDMKMVTDSSSHDGDCDEEDEELGDEEELSEIHYSIETILEGLLGGTLDDASVDLLYPNSSFYNNLFSGYHEKLVEVVQNLSKALQKALHNLPAENGITPTTAHAALKSVITALVQECQDIPYLQSCEQKEDCESSIPFPFDFSEIFSSYDNLVAAAVINKIVEESQSKFLKNSFSEFEENAMPDISANSDHQNENLVDDHHDDKTLIDTPFGLPIECVKIEEEIEEVTQEFTDSEDDKLSSISKWSNSLQSMDEVGVQKHSDFDVFIDMDHPHATSTPFPEFGCNLVNEAGKEDMDATSHVTSISTWEENWLFRKKHRVPLYSNLKYQLLTYCDEPPSMLIPCPSEPLDSLEEFSSELSETHSAGSLEFSSDLEDTSMEFLKPDEPEIAIAAECLTELRLEDMPCELGHSQAPCDSSLTITAIDKSGKADILIKCHKTDESHTYSSCENNPSVESKSQYASINISPKQESNLDPFNKTDLHSIKNRQSPQVKNFKTDIQNANLQKTYKESPPRPGTIAEREHQKWQNAIPLKNNPYSAENISKRNSHHRVVDGNSASFEEFERKLSVSSERSESPIGKVNCGPKLIDSSLYKRDYYINSASSIDLHEFNLPPPALIKYEYLQDDCFEALPEEALNSFEEKVYVRSGKVFTLENHVKRLEKEIKDPSYESLRERAYFPNNLPQMNNFKNMDSPVLSEDNMQSSVKCLPAKRESVNDQVFLENLGNSSSNSMKIDEKFKKGKPCRKIHSLTARSMSREFRDMAKQNAPKPMNRTIPVSSSSNQEASSDLDTNENPQFSLANNQASGYTSDESNTSSNSVTKGKSRRPISRSILERATYWERRAEHGLLSDASVSEEFPAIDLNP